MFSRKHYEAIAKAINKVIYNHPITCDRLTINDVINNLSQEFEAENPNFKSDKFREACYGTVSIPR